ncbi:hypothetical protein AGOR_G00197730 [Albula goreensis]|uniref:Uncharacterized protein n=1 Tax=Albula goreensis TaxID=1534307 RepID=A0A8T3CVI4_9TELE|nr:hypothetical protein AGOR_G00197730 [Albula goreensis]
MRFVKACKSSLYLIKMTSPYFTNKGCADILIGTKTKPFNAGGMTTLSGLKVHMAKEQPSAGSAVYVKEESEDFAVSNPERDRQSPAPPVQSTGRPRRQCRREPLAEVKSEEAEQKQPRVLR